MKATEYCKRVFDGTHDTPKPSSEGFKLLTSKNVLNGFLDKSDAYLISKSDFDSVNKRSQVKQWDVLFSMIGTVGNICIVKDKVIDFAIKNMGDFSCEDEKKAKWLFFYLQSPYAKSLIRNYLNGAVQKFLPLGWLRDLDIPEYDKEKEQITAILWNIDSKIENNNVIISELESMAKDIYDYWFVQFDFPDASGRPYRSSGGKMVWNEELKREIPEGWKAEQIEKYISIVRGIGYKPNDELSSRQNGSVSLLKSNNIQDGKINFEQPVFLPGNLARKDQWLTKGSVFITMSSGSKAHMGKTAIVFKNLPYVFGAFCAKIEIKNTLCCYLSTYFRSELFRAYIENVTAGTSINNISTEQLNNIILPIPNAEVLQLFEKTIAPLFDMQGELNEQNQELTSLRDWLLPMLMNGQVKVGKKNFEYEQTAPYMMAASKDETYLNKTGE